MNDIDKLKRDFLEYLEIERGSALKTIENYDLYLSRFLDFAQVKKPNDITENSVRQFRLSLNKQLVGNGQTLSKKTQNYYMIALRMFLKCLKCVGSRRICLIFFWSLSNIIVFFFFSTYQ